MYVQETLLLKANNNFKKGLQYKIVALSGYSAYVGTNDKIRG